MALVGMSEDLYVNAFVTCIICEQAIPTRHATVGVTSISGQSAFACNQHVAQRGTWITAWAHMSNQSGAGGAA